MKYLFPIVLIVVALLWDGKRGKPAPSVPNAPAITEPTGDLKAAVSPITAKLAGNRADALRFAAFYRAFADAVSRGTVTSTGQFRTAHQNALLSAYKATSLAGRYDVGKDVDAAIAKHLGGLDRKQLDEAGRAKLVEALRAVAWSFEQVK